MIKIARKTYFLFFIFFIALSTSIAQNNYFQQEVDYKIKVSLDDSLHTLKGWIDITYKNNAPETLNEIYFHLWGNAFKNRSTAFSKQQILQHSTKFYYADDEDLGYYENINFQSDGAPITWTLDEENIDIAKLTLNEGLASGQTMVISTPFTLKIPASFSRLGHVETSYQMTQWYPKPAVYDHNGWHQMPYLNMGEFYSEFGDFDVEITLPENYYVAATGELETEREKKKIEDRIEFTKAYLEDSIYTNTDFPISSKGSKTLRYTAQNVHDFAWFADKRFLIQRDEAKLANGEIIECNSFFTDEERELWKKSAFYVARAVKFYSENVGDYPYPQATAVQSALSAGGGMEYPMITVIGLSGSPLALDQVITHEVGHNWFYGILASNERKFPWMDEGMNSFHDHKYTDVFYKDQDMFSGMMPKKIGEQLEYPINSYVYHIWAKLGKDQAPNTASDDLTLVNYFLGAYEKPAMAFKLLENYLGEELFIKAMKNYYQEWSFKHPQPEDTKISFEKYTGKDLTWLFDGMLFSNATYDYKISSVSGSTISLKNKGSIAPPFQLSYEVNGEMKKGSWQEGFQGETEIVSEFENATAIIIDDEKISLDLNPKNDVYKIKGSNIIPPSFKFLSGIRTSQKNKVFLLPTLGVNKSDGLELGLAFHNYGIPISTFQYYINPALGVNSKEVVGSFEFRKDFPQKKNALRNISIALGGKSFHEFYNAEDDYNLRFTRIQPSIEFEWQKKLVSQVKHFLRYRPITIVNDNPIFGRETGFEGLVQEVNVIHDLGYELYKSSPLNPMTARLNAEFRSYENFGNREQYLKLYGSVDSKFAYKSKKFLNIRLFGGFFPMHSERQKSTRSAVGNFSMFYRGFNDYRYDQHFIDRNGQSGFLSRQVSWQDGGFKNGISNAFGLGLSNNFMASVNFSIDLPFGSRLIPLKPYIDAGIYSYKPTSNDAFRSEVLYSGGIMLDFEKVVNVYFPLFSSEQINNIYASNENIWQRISFSIDINELNPHKLKRWFTR